MSERSSRYTGQETFTPNIRFGYGSCTYEWSNPSTPTDYYQSYVTTGLASVDPTIWLFQRPDDDYTIGRTLSFIYNGTASNPAEPRFEDVKNNYKRNFECPAYHNNIHIYTYQQQLYNAKYSPDAIQYAIDTAQRFFLNFIYSDIVLYPSFDIMYMSGNTVLRAEGINFNQLEEYFANYETYVCSMYINTYYGKTNSENEPRNVQSFYPYIQFAGSIPTFTRTSNSEGVYYDKSGVSSGVFLYASPERLFDTPNIFWRPELSARYALYVTSSSTRTLITPFHSSLFTKFYHTNGQVARYGIADITTIKNIMDRFGFYWAKNLTSATSSKTGSHCTDPNIRCAVIDPETNIIQTEAYEGSEISDYANSNPESSFNWDTGAYDYNGVTIPEIVQNTNPEQPTTEPADEIDLNEPVLATSGGTSIWLMNQEKLEEFFTYLWNLTEHYLMIL